MYEKICSLILIISSLFTYLYILLVVSLSGLDSQIIVIRETNEGGRLEQAPDSSAHPPSTLMTLCL
jgi:hypothetical protein